TLIHVKAEIFYSLHPARFRIECYFQIFYFKEFIRHFLLPVYLGSSASRIPSPMKTSRLSISETVTKAEIPSHGACRFDLPAASSSPMEGEPGGMPKPRKSSEVRTPMEPLSMNGRNVMAATRALGSMWRNIMTESRT